MMDDLVLVLSCFVVAWYVFNFVKLLGRSYRKWKQAQLRVKAAKRLVEDFKVDRDLESPYYDLAELNEQYNRNRPG